MLKLALLLRLLRLAHGMVSRRSGETVARAFRAEPWSWSDCRCVIANSVRTCFPRPRGEIAVRAIICFMLAAPGIIGRCDRLGTPHFCCAQPELNSNAPHHHHCRERL